MIDDVCAGCLLKRALKYWKEYLCDCADAELKYSVYPESGEEF